ncbi:hypothetical protein R1flu_014879 [Riccia fluitans]|uniref:Alpha-type protein kinase domain-containing protein n=1 Tax=Riccia fluitans TaxID=41844 RepID=A0ABD1YHM5_9MARC
MAAGISLSYKQCKLRFALAVYRDYDTPQVAGPDGCDFTNDYKGASSTFARALSQIQNLDGGDFAEDVFTGLEKAAKLDWQAMNRLLIHIGDAPCHGRQFHDGVGLFDSYPEGDKYKRNISTILQRLRENCEVTHYCFCHITNLTQKMLKEFRKAAGNDDWIEEWEVYDLSRVPEKVVDTTKAAISKSINVVRQGNNGGQSNVKETVDTRIPDWDSLTSQEGTVYCHRSCSSVELLLKTIREARPPELIKSAKCNFQIALFPFSDEGNVRYPYYARASETGSNRTGRIEVVKRFKTKLGRSARSQHTKERYVQQMEVQTVARQLAVEFNKSTSRLRGVAKVVFTEVSLLDMDGKFYTKERLLRGEWIRFSNTAEYVNKINYAATLQAFSHWSYWVTSGMLLVTDLQGVKLQDEVNPGKHMFLLCDPAIHTDDANVLRFTNTNLGKEG